MFCGLSARTNHCSEQQLAQHLFFHRSFKVGFVVSVRRFNKQSDSDPVTLLACCSTRGRLSRLMYSMVVAGSANVDRRSDRKGKCNSIRLWRPGVRQFVKWYSKRGKVIKMVTVAHKLSIRWHTQRNLRSLVVSHLPAHKQRVQSGDCAMRTHCQHIERQETRANVLFPNVMNFLPADLQCQRL